MTCVFNAVEAQAIVRVIGAIGSVRIDGHAGLVDKGFGQLPSKLINQVYPPQALKTLFPG